MTPARFPHSDTPGSTLGCQLPRAYRRLLRPSSALDAKASTTCPSQLVTHTTNPTPNPQPTGNNPQATTLRQQPTGHRQKRDRHCTQHATKNHTCAASQSTNDTQQTNNHTPKKEV